MNKELRSSSLGDVLTLVAEALQGLRYGEVVIQIHNGQVVQIDRTDKVRPQPPPMVSSKG